MDDRKEILMQFVEQIKYIIPDESVEQIIWMLENCVLSEDRCENCDDENNCDDFINCENYEELNSPDKPHMRVNALIEQYNELFKENRCSLQG